MIEKRYSLRPYGWPDEEVLLLVARLLVLGEISLMMDGALVPDRQGVRGDHDPGQTPQDRRSASGRRPTPRRSRTPAAWARNCSPRWGRTARTACSPSCKRKLKGWQAALHGYKPLADTGNYPGKDEIADGLAARSSKLLADKDSYKFIERFNALKNDLLDLADALPRPGTLLRSPEADLGEAPQGARRLPAQPAGTGEGRPGGPGPQADAGNPVGRQPLRPDQGGRRPDQRPSTR